MKSRLVLLGPPASGKGTLAAALSECLGLPAVSTGAILRKEKERGSEIGRLAASFTDRGLYFPDEVALQIVQAWLEKNGPRFLFDGFPRSLPQAQAFDAELTHRRAPLEAVISLEVPPEEIIRRVLDRLTCAGCGQTYSASRQGLDLAAACQREGCEGRLVRRDDDQLPIIENRLRQHETLTRPLVEFYRAHGILHELDGVGSPGEVLRRALALLGETDDSD